MGNRKRKINPVEKPLSPKTTRSSKKAKKDESNDIVKASLPVLSDEKIYFDDSLVKTIADNKVEDKILRVVLPKIKIKCEPLNVEKIIDLQNNGKVTDVIKKVEKKTEKNSKKPNPVKRKTPKVEPKKNLEKDKKNIIKFKPPRIVQTSEKKLYEVKQTEIVDNVAVSLQKAELNDSIRKKKIKILINGSQVMYEDESISYNSSFIQENNYEQSFQASTIQGFQSQSSTDLNKSTCNLKENLYSTLYNLDDESAMNELKDVNLEELAPSLESICVEELKMKSVEFVDGSKDIEFTNSNYLFDTDNISNSREESQCDQNQDNYELGSFKENTLQTAVEAFMKNPQLNYLKENTALKKGLCFTWLSNNYKCDSEQCVYSHNAVSLFTKKLKQYPSKFIMTVVVSMRNDTLFVDVILAAFKILSERKIPIIWITFLIYFVFYVTEPSDSRFLKFWVNASRFFYQLGRNYGAAAGYASLLSIFSEGEKTEEWKIIEFIKKIKEPPVQVPTTFALLQPVLKLNVPSQLLTEAIESSIETKVDLLKVYSNIIPKIPLMTSPVQVIELLLKFCKALEDADFKNYAEDLKLRLQPKVLSFKTTISRGVYPLTAFFQEELSRSVKEDGLLTFPSIQENSVQDLAIVGVDNDYFELQEDFYNAMNETIALSSGSMPQPFRSEMKTDKTPALVAKEEDVGEHQITRIRQFFRDCQFDLLGKYLNELRYNVVDRAAEVILKLLLHMKISLQQVVDLVKIIALPCKSENAAKIVASVSVTLILNLVKINQWEKAHVIAKMCKEKNINLVTGKVFHLNELNSVTECRIVLLLIEIYAYKSDYSRALELVKEYSLYSSDCSVWKAACKPYDETIRVRIIEDLLSHVISCQKTETAYDLFETVWKAQSTLSGSVDLRKYANEILILLLNQGNENAVNLYETFKNEVHLNDITARAVLVTMVRQNQLSAAKSLLLSKKQNVYFLPEIKFGTVKITISNCWLEEEIYVMFDAFFDSLVTQKQKFLLTDFENLEVNIEILKSDKVPCLSFRPLCLGIIKPHFKDVCYRVQRVLQYQFNPPLKLIIQSLILKVDESTLKLHLRKRMNQNPY